MSKVIQIHPAKDFKARSKLVLDNVGQRKNFRGAMDFLQAKRRAQFTDDDELQGLRELGASIRRYSLANLPRLLEQLEAKLTVNGVQVHWAQNGAEANAIALQIAQRVNAKHIIKGKSMVSEEIGFNHAMEAAGIEAFESDMGEYIVQLAGEAPSHIIMPAIHKTKQEIAQLFADEVPGVTYTEDVDALIQIGRRVLRRKFADADIGLSGVNFAVAETGTLCLVENEGNGRMCTTVPRVHIAINMISGPRKPGEKDGPQEVHLILLDNGRTQAYADDELRATLQCIRCGACMNHCPVYARIGGHAYGTTYPGPIGAIISPHMLGLEATYPLAFASTLCGACNEVCPVKIPITDILVRLRSEAQAKPDTEEATLRGSGAARTLAVATVWSMWSQVYSKSGLYKLASWFMSRGRSLSPSEQGAWTRSRTPLTPAPKRLRDLMKDRKP
jgi:L-lactate dehydrogenase complex protein LldF